MHGETVASIFVSTKPAHTHTLHTRCFIWSCRYARPRVETAVGLAGPPPAIALVAEIRATLRIQNIMLLFACFCGRLRSRKRSRHQMTPGFSLFLTRSDHSLRTTIQSCSTRWADGPVKTQFVCTVDHQSRV
jgi:hypothetical protein